MSLLISLDSTGRVADDFTISFASPITLSSDYEVTLLSLSYVNSIRNIDTSYNNTTFRYSPDNGSTWKTVTIPSGGYGLYDIDTYFKTVMKANNDYTAATPTADEIYYLSFSVNANVQRVVLTVSNNYQFDFATGDFRLLIGAPASVISATTTLTTAADLSRGISSLYLNCDLVNGSTLNGVASQHIASFTPDVPPGILGLFTPTSRYYMPISVRSIQRIRVYFTDQDARPVSFFGEAVTVDLHLRPVNKSEL